MCVAMFLYGCYIFHSLSVYYTAISICVIISPVSTKLKGWGILVSRRPSVRLVHLSVRASGCGQNRIRSVTSTILAGYISYLHILISNSRRCVARKDFSKIPKCEFLVFFSKFVILTLFCFDLGSGAHFTNIFSITIQMWSKFHFTLVQNLTRWSLQNFAHGTTAVLSWHVKILWQSCEQWLNYSKAKFPSNLNCEQNSVSEMGSMNQ